MPVFASFIPIVLLLMIVVTVLSLRRIADRRSALDGGTSEAGAVDLRGSGEAFNVPVRGLRYRRGFGTMSKNTMFPRLAIAGDGLRFRIFRETHLPFAEIDRVELRSTLFGGCRLFVHSGGERRLLIVSVGNTAIANAFLAALPIAIPLSPEAADLRQGAVVAAVLAPSRSG